jgi:hypothetical protein
MVATFDEAGIRFRYPENWKLEQQKTENGWSVTVQSPDTAFLLLSLHEDAPKPRDLAESVLETMRQEYEELEADKVVDTVAGQRAIGHEINFFSLDFSNTCWTRAFSIPAGTVLVMWQMNDLELEKNGQVLRAICVSIVVDGA